MPQFAYRLRPTRLEMLSASPTESESRIVMAHYEYLKDLTAKGTVLVAGRTLVTDESTFGIVILEAADEAAARAIMNRDPAVAQGVMRAELWPFRVALWSNRGPAPEGN
jgi:uncharacterized protein YciI